jgi:predicted DNA binding CopG/RHH family protein/uncharacterized DUF497 family protein
MNGREIEFVWDEVNVGHVARHCVLPEEAEQAVLNDPVDLAIEIVEGEDRYLSLGATLEGRVLLVVTTFREDRIRIVTAFEPIKRLIRFYYQEREGWSNKMAKKRPHFKNETQEAEWWPKNQDLIANRLEQARSSGKLGKGTVARVAGERAKQAGASPTITIRIAEGDLARARVLAAEKGLRYQTYLKMLLHQALNAEEHNAGRP